MLRSESTKPPREKGHGMFRSISTAAIERMPAVPRMLLLTFIWSSLILGAIAPAARSVAALPTTIVPWGLHTSGTEIPNDLTNAVSIAASGNHSVAIRADGTVVGWGDKFSGQDDALAGVTDVKAISLGSHHGLLLRSNGVVLGWGDGTSGENTVPSNLSNVVAIAAGGFHNLALKRDGTVVAWGANFIGQADVPPGLSNVIAIAAGNSYNDGQHSLALKSDGTVAAWGYNFFGESTVPAGLSNVVAISAGWYHNVALKSDGTVVAWGDNENGQIDVPEGLSGVVAIVAGPWHNLAIKSDSTVVTWGRSWDGLAEIPSGLSNVAAVAAGENYSLALTERRLPLILQQPVGASVYASSEDGYGMGVEAIGPGPLSYQWRHDGVDLPGETTQNLWISAIQASEAGAYDVVVSNPFGSVTSEPAILPGDRAFFITVQPMTQTIPAGQTAMLSVHAKGSRSEERRVGKE